MVELPSIRWCIIARVGGNAASILLQKQLGLLGELRVIENRLRRNVPRTIIQCGCCCIKIDSRNLVRRLRGLGALGQDLLLGVRVEIHEASTMLILR
jgi:hypothetical protein